jgi:hypothetical protein
MPNAVWCSGWLSNGRIGCPDCEMGRAYAAQILNALQAQYEDLNERMNEITFALGLNGR